MADLTSLYKNKPKRDLTIQACVDCLNKIALKYPSQFMKGFFTDYFDISGGTQPPKSTFINEPKEGFVRFLQIRDFSSEDTPTFIPISKTNKQCSEDDILLGRYGASVGKILTGKTGAYNVACAKIIFLNNENIDKDFLFYWLHSTYFQNFLKSITRSAQGGFNKNDISRIETYFPSKERQIILVSILKLIDDSLLSDKKVDLNELIVDEIESAFIELINRFLSIINENEELVTESSFQLDLLKKLRQQILQDAVQGKLVSQDPNDEPAFKLLKRIKGEKEQLVKEKKIRKDKPLPEIKPDEIPFGLPKNWGWCRLGDICAKIGSGSTPNGSNYSNIGIPFFRSQNILDNGLAFDDIKYISNEVHKQMDGTIVYPSDVLLNITGGSLGRCALVPSDFQEGNVSQHVCIIRPITLSNTYIQKVVLSPFFQKMIFGSTTGAGREGLPKYNLEQFLIPIPPLPEQERIVTKIEQLMTICDELGQTIEQNQKYTQELLKVALKEALEPSTV